MKLISVSFDVKLITPLFMGGEDKNSSALRSASVKGLMRYWWRAIKSSDDIHAILNQEVDIFGGQVKLTDKKINAQRSSFNLTVEPLAGCDEAENFKYSLLGMGAKYLFYSFNLGDNKKRKYIPNEATYKINLSGRREEKLKEAIAALWCMIYLGGSGSRARRGAGNMIAENVTVGGIGIEDKKYFDSLTSFFIPRQLQSPDQVKQWYENCYRGLGISGMHEKFEHLPEYPYLKNARLLIFKASHSWQEALNLLGGKFQSYRTGRGEGHPEKEPDRTMVKQFLRGGIAPDHIRRTAFGMPLNFGSVVLQPEHSSRCASPVIIKVVESNGRYFPLLLLMAGEHPMHGSKKQKINNSIINDPPQGILQRFYTWIKKEMAPNVEVIFDVQ